MDLQAIRIAETNRDALLDISAFTPADVDAMIEHYTNMEVYAIIQTHDNQVSSSWSAANGHHMKSNYKYNRKLIQKQLTPISLK